MKSQLIGKDPDAGKDRGRENKEVTEDDMVGWHHQFNGYDFEQTPGESEGQGSLAYSSTWGHEGSPMTEQLKQQDSHRNINTRTSLKSV